MKQKLNILAILLTLNFTTSCASNLSNNELKLRPEEQKPIKKVEIPQDKCTLFHLQAGSVFYNEDILKCDLGEEICYIRGIRGVSCIPKKGFGK